MNSLLYLCLCDHFNEEIRRRLEKAANAKDSASKAASPDFDDDDDDSSDDDSDEDRE